MGEQRYYHKTAIQIAKEMGISVVATDFGYLRPDWITFERDGMSVNSNFPRDPVRINSLAKQCSIVDFTPRFQDSFRRMAFWAILYHLSSSLCHFLYPGYRSHQKHHPVLVGIGMGIRLLRNGKAQSSSNRAIASIQNSNSEYFLFPLQMATDFQIRSYSPYEKLDDAIEEVIQSFASHAPKSTKLFIKIHPLDPGLKNWAQLISKLSRKNGVDARVYYLKGGDLSKLLEKTRGVVTVNSTVGLWALRKSCPIKLLGEAIYDVVGLVDKQSLDDFWIMPKPPNPDLSKNFFKALADTVQLRGVFYNRPGLDAAVDVAVYRLENNLINSPLLDLKVKNRPSLAK
ncbi:MAG: capsular biosynthesis protein [Proteobacteria bacterium]|nr:capsular biosynthesis protein [Pseudomonadota bacterium]